MLKIVKRFPLHLFLLLLGCYATLSAFGQYRGYTEVTDVVAFKKQFAAESAKLSSIASDFTQEKELSALSEKIISEGKFWFKRSDKVRIDYTTPFKYKMILNRDKMMIKDAQKESTVNVKSNKLFQQVNHIIMDCVQGTILDSKDFTSHIYQDEKHYLLEMKPVSKTLKDFFSTIVLVVDKKDYAVSTLEMNEPTGDRTSMKFSNKILNKTIADEVFSL